jgi:hypothetical protein
MRKALILILCLVLQACGAIKLTYNNADTLLYFWLDSYVDVSLDQKPRIRDELVALQQWHRKTQLPVFVGMAQTLQKQVQGDVTAALLCSNADQALALIPPLTNYLEPTVLWLATSLSADQLVAIQKKIDKTNKDWRKDWMPAKSQDLIKKTEKNIRDRLEPLYGSLTEGQLQLLRDTIPQSPFNDNTALAERLRQQKDLMDTLKTIQQKNLTASEAKVPLSQFLLRTQESPDTAYKAYAARVKQHNCNLFARLHNTMSAQQRAFALDTLKGYEQDFRALQVAR